MGKTKIIAVEGIDGSGKTVQIKMLKSYLSSLGRSVAVRTYPVYDSYFGAHIGRLLSGAENICATEIDGKSMALWFALDRWEDMRTYRDGESDYLLINRYTLSNAVYQSIRECRLGRADIFEWVLDLEFNHFGIPRPDVSIVLDVGTTRASSNVDSKGFRGYVGKSKDVYEGSSVLQELARKKYLECALKCGGVYSVRCMNGDKMLSPNEIARKTTGILREAGLV